MLPNALLSDFMGVMEAETNRARVIARGTVLRGAAAAFAGVLMLGAAAFLAVSGYQTLLLSMSPFAAGAIVAASLAGLAIIVLLYAFLRANRRARTRAKAEAALARAALAGDVATAFASVRVLGISPAVIGIGALAAGVLAGASGGGEKEQA